MITIVFVASKPSQVVVLLSVWMLVVGARRRPQEGVAGADLAQTLVSARKQETGDLKVLSDAKFAVTLKAREPLRSPSRRAQSQIMDNNKGVVLDELLQKLSDPSKIGYTAPTRI